MCIYNIAERHESSLCLRSLKCAERRVTTLKTQIEELKSELNAANVELEDAKGTKELVEQELKGYEVQLFLTEASVQTLEVNYSPFDVKY